MNYVRTSMTDYDFTKSTTVKERYVWNNKCFNILLTRGVDSVLFSYTFIKAWKSIEKMFHISSDY